VCLIPVRTPLFVFVRRIGCEVMERVNMELTETVKSYIPGLAPKEEPSARKEPDEGTRPQRPGDDPKVEGFLRGVYATGNEVGDGKNGGK